MRGGLTIIDARHLTGQFLQVRSRIARDKDFGVVAVPGQRNIARRRSPMLRMVEISLIERPALALVDRAGISVPEVLELLGVKRDHPSRPAVQFEMNGRVLDLGDRAGMAVEEATLLVGADDLNAVAGRIRLLSARGFECVILAQLAAFTAHAPDGKIDLADIVIRVGKDE